MSWDRPDFERHGFNFDEAAPEIQTRFLDYWNRNITTSPQEFADHIKYRQALDVSIYVDVNQMATPTIPEGALKLGVLVFPDSAFGNYSNSDFFIENGIVVCDNTVNIEKDSPRFDMPKLEAGSILASADVGVDRLSRYAWGGAGQCHLATQLWLYPNRCRMAEPRTG